MAKPFSNSLVLPAGSVRLGILLLVGGAVPLAHASSVTVQSSRAFLEPSAAKAGDKDGCPPTSSSADPEEITMQAKLVVTSAITSPTVVLVDTNFPAGEKRSKDDLTLDEFSTTNGAGVTGGTRDIDYLDGIDDNKLAVGTYYTYFNLDKTGYNQETLVNCAGNSITGNRDRYAVTLKQGATTVATNSLTIIGEASTSVDQNDLDWLDTQPALNEAEVGDNFCIRTKYRQSSANSVDYLIAHIYHHADRIQLDSVDLYHYDTNGADPGSIEDGIPGVNVAGTTPSNSYLDTVYFSPTGTVMPASQSSGDHWVANYCFTVVGEGSSRFIPYFITQQSGTTGTWKTDSGYEGWISEPPPVNPPVLDIFKTCDASVPSLTGGSTATVTESIEVCNTGNGDAVSVVLVDSLPVDPNVVYSSSTGGGTFDNATSTIEWLLGDMLAGACQTVEFTLIVTPDALDTSISTNAGATVDGLMEIDPTQSVTASTAETCDIPVNPSFPTLSLGKLATGYTDADANGTLSPGDTVQYTLSYSNTGTGAATGVVLVDNPDETYVSSISGLSGGTYNGDIISWSVGTIAAGATGSVSYSAVLGGAGTFADGVTNVPNTATISSSNHADVSADESVAVSAAAAISIQKTATGFADLDGNGTLSPGDDIYYELAYSNPGNADATLVTVVDDIDESLVAGVSNISDLGSFDGDLIAWDLGTVFAGESGILTYTVSVAAAGTFADGTTPLANTVVMTSAETEPTGDSETVFVDASAALAIDKSSSGYTDVDGNGTLSPGDIVNYSVTVTNTGNAASTGTTLSDDFDQTYVDAITGSGTSDGNVVIWDLGTLAPGASATVTYTATLRGAGSFVHGSTSVNNTATADSNETDGVSDSASVSVSATASLSVAKASTSWSDIDADGVLSPGDEVTYQVDYANTGNATATNVTLVDDPDEGYVVFVDSVDGIWDGSTISWGIGSLGAGQVGSVTYTVTLGGAGLFAHGDTDVVNTVELTSDQTTPTSDTETVVVTASAALSIDKATSGYVDNDGNGELSPGDTVHYVVNYTNTGNAAATSVALVDSPDISAVGSIGNISDAGVFNGSTVNWTVGTVEAGVSGSVSYDLVLAAAGNFAHGSTPVANTATITSPETGSASDSESVTVVAAASLSIAKSAVSWSDVDGDGALSPGDEVNYQVSYANTGNATANSVSLVDDPDESGFADIIAISDGGLYDGDVVAWDLVALSPGEAGSVSYTAILHGAGAFASGATPVGNTVVLSSSETPPVTDSEEVVVVAQAEITIDKAVSGTTDVDGDGQLSPGDVITYAITVNNPSNADATGVTLIDVPETTYVASVGAISNGGTYDGSTINWTLGTVATGSSVTVSYQVTLAAAGGFTHGSTTIGNVATADSNETSPVTDDTSVTVSAAAELTLVASIAGYTDTDGNGVLSPGDDVTWQLDFANIGNAAATNASLVDIADDPLVAAISSSTGGGIVSGSTISWDLGTLDVGESGSVTWTGTLGAAGVFAHGTTIVTDDATLDSMETAPVFDAASTVVTASASLAVTKSSTGYTDNDGSGALSPGDTVHYAVSYANTGNAAATGVTVVDDPEDSAIASVTNITGGGVYDGDTINWAVGTVGVGGSATLTYDVTLGGAGTFADGATAVHNVVVVDSSETDPVTDDETVTVTADAELVVAKGSTGWADVDGNGALSPGDTVSYSVDYANTGDASATNVLLTDNPDEAWVVAVSGITGGGTYDGNQITWSIGTLAAGASGTVSYTVTLAGSGTFPDGSTSVANVAVLSSTEDGPVSADETVEVAAEPILQPAKSVSSTTAVTTSFSNTLVASSNETAPTSSSAATTSVTTSTRIGYTLSVTNSGTATASGVTLEDTLPVGTTFESATGAYTVAGGVVTWEVGNLNPGASESVTLSVLTD